MARTVFLSLMATFAQLMAPVLLLPQELAPHWQVDLGPRTPDDAQFAAVCADKSTLVASSRGQLSVVGASGEVRLKQTVPALNPIGGLVCFGSAAMILSQERLLTVDVTRAVSEQRIRTRAASLSGAVQMVALGPKGPVAFVRDHDRGQWRQLDRNGKDTGVWSPPAGSGPGAWIARPDGNIEVFEFMGGKHSRFNPEGRLVSTNELDGVAAAFSPLTAKEAVVGVDPGLSVPRVAAAIALSRDRSLIWATRLEVLDNTMKPPLAQTEGRLMVVTGDGRVLQSFPSNYGVPVGADKDENVYLLDAKWAGVTLTKVSLPD